MSYVYYNDTDGSLVCVSNEIDDGFGTNYIECDEETHNKFSNGTYFLHDFVVIANPNNPLVKKLLKRDEHKEIDIDSSVQTARKLQTTVENAFVITQDVKQGTWTVTTTFDEIYLSYYSQLDSYKEMVKEVYVIKNNNTNILLDTLLIDFNQLLSKNVFKIKGNNKTVAKQEDISLICYNTGDEFIHMVK